MKRLNRKLKWVETAGGPFALLAREDLPKWAGCFGKLSLVTGKFVLEENLTYSDQTHYDSVGAFKRLIGEAIIDGIQVLILGDEPAITAWVPFTANQGGLLIRWIYANEEEAIINRLDKIPTKGWEYETKVELESEEYVLFDSAVWEPKSKKEKA